MLLLLLLIGFGLFLTSNNEPQSEPMAPPLSAIHLPFHKNPLPVIQAVLEHNYSDTIIEISESTQLFVPSDAFADASGNSIDEPVFIQVQEILSPIETFLSGIPMALDTGSVLKSAGMFNIQGSTSSGKQVNIRPEKYLELELASLDTDSSYTAWILDTLSGQWSEIPAFTEVVEQEDESILEEIEKQIPAPPVVASAFSFTVGDDTGGQPELAEYANVRFEPVDGKPCGFTCTEINVYPKKNGIYDVQFIGHKYGYKEIAREETCSCYLAFEEGESYSEGLKSYQRKHRKLLKQRQDERDRVERAWNRYQRALARQQMCDVKDKSEWSKRSAEKRVHRTLQVLQFGILNIDKPYVIDAPVKLLASYLDSTQTEIQLQNVQVIDLTNQVLYPSSENLVAIHPRMNQVLFGTTASGHLAYAHIRDFSDINAAVKSFSFPMKIVHLEQITPEALIDLIIPPEST